MQSSGGGGKRHKSFGMSRYRRPEMTPFFKLLFSGNLFEFFFSFDSVYYSLTILVVDVNLRPLTHRCASISISYRSNSSTSSCAMKDSELLWRMFHHPVDCAIDR